MAFWNRQKEKKTEKRSTDTTPQHTPWCDALLFGSNLKEQNAMCLSAVYRATELISDSVATLPIRINKRDGKHKAETTEHPLYNWLQNGGLVSKFTTVKLLIQSVILRGNGFALIDRDKQGNAISLRYLEAKDVTINYDRLKGTLDYTVVGLRQRVEPCNMIHLLKNSYDGVNGISVLKYASRTLATANAEENAAQDYFKNGGNLAGIIKVEGKPPTKEQKEQIKNAWRQAYSDGGNGVAVLEGNLNYQPVQSKAAESQLLESRQYDVQSVARFFGVSPVLLGDLTHSSYSTLEAVQLDFIQHNLQPYIKLMEEELNRKLLRPSDRKALIIDLDDTALIKADKQATVAYYNGLLNSGVLCINEVRESLGLAPIEGGDQHHIAYTDTAKTKITDSNGGIK